MIKRKPEFCKKCSYRHASLVSPTEKVDAVLGKGKAMDIAGRAFLQTSLLDLFYNKDYSARTTVEWEQVRQRLQKELAVVDRGKISRLVEWLQVNYAKVGH